MPNVLFSLRKSVSDLRFSFTLHFACCLETITILLARQRSRQVCADAYLICTFERNRDILLVRQRSACADAYLICYLLDVPAAKKYTDQSALCRSGFEKPGY